MSATLAYFSKLWGKKMAIHLRDWPWPQRASPATFNCPSFAAQVFAVEGIVTAPAEKFESAHPSYVGWHQCYDEDGDVVRPNSGKVSIVFTANRQTYVRFALEVLCLSNQANSFHLQVDASSQYPWSATVCSEFIWQTADKWWNLRPGHHTLHVAARGDGAKLSKVRINRGDAEFSLGTCTAPHVEGKAPAGGAAAPSDHFSGGRPALVHVRAVSPSPMSPGCRKKWQEQPSRASPGSRDTATAGQQPRRFQTRSLFFCPDGDQNGPPLSHCKAFGE